MDISLVATPTGAMTRSDPKDPKKVHDAACQFEALMIGEMLKTAKEDSANDPLGGDDADSATGLAGDIGQEFFAQAIANSGGLGLASTIERGLKAEAARHHAVSTTV